MKFEFTREDAHMIRNALAAQVAQSEILYKNTGLVCYGFEGKCWKELVENFDRQYDKALADSILKERV